MLCYVDFRCQIPECGELSQRAPFEPEWVLNAIPPASGSGATHGFASCERYVPLSSNGSLNYCPANIFDQSNTVGCTDFVYERYNSVVYDVSLSLEQGS